MGARVLVHESVYDKFMNALVVKVSKIRLGDPFSEETQVISIKNMILKLFNEL